MEGATPMLLALMYNFQVVLIIGMFLLIGCLALTIALTIFQIFTKKEPTVRKIFVGLKPKLFMTAALGSFFLVLYICLVLLGAYFLHGEVRQTLFMYVRNYPIYFVYGGMALFVTISLTILLIRSFIKRFYNSR